MKEVETAARALSFEVDTIEIRKAEEIAPVFATLKDRAGALYVVGDPLIFTNRVRISTLALGARLPTMCNFREYVQAGGLMSYGPNFPDLRCIDVANNGQVTKSRDDLAKELESLAGKVRLLVRQTSKVSSSRGRLATKPVSTGSPAVAKTIGIIDVACFAASVGAAA